MRSSSKRRIFMRGRKRRRKNDDPNSNSFHLFCSQNWTRTHTFILYSKVSILLSHQNIRETIRFTRGAVVIIPSFVDSFSTSPPLLLFLRFSVDYHHHSPLREHPRKKVGYCRETMVVPSPRHKKVNYACKNQKKSSSLSSFVSRINGREGIPIASRSRKFCITKVFEICSEFIESFLLKI